MIRTPYSAEYEVGSEAGRQQAVEHLWQFGHVLITDAYDPALAEAALAETHQLRGFSKPHGGLFVQGDESGYTVVPETATKTGMELDDGPPNLSKLRRVIAERAALVGQPLLPAAAGRQPVDELMEMRHERSEAQPPVPAPAWVRSIGSGRGPVVAIVNLQGRSRLEVGDTGNYLLRPGAVALFLTAQQRGGAERPQKFGQGPTGSESPAQYINYLITTQPTLKVF